MSEQDPNRWSAINPTASPIREPPPTEFPHPENKTKERSASCTRHDSDATLTEKVTTPSKDQERDIENESGQHSDASDVSQSNRSSKQSMTEGATAAERPSLASRKFETEIARPVGGRPHIGLMERNSTGGRPQGGPLASQYDNMDDSTTDFSSSSDEDGDDDGNVMEGEAEKEQGRKSGRTPMALKRLTTRQELSKARLNKTKRATVPNRFSIMNDHFTSHGKVAPDGRLNISLNETANSGYLAKALGATIRSHLHPQAQQEKADAEENKKQYRISKPFIKIPRMNIVIMVIGSRGDIQPFIKIGKILQDKYNHRVRIATHPTFRKFVQDEMGLEFFSIGGDPSELMSFMVKNPGLIPSFETLKAGEVGKRRDQMYEMFQGFWRACINTTDDEKDTANAKMLGNKFPFIADAIIANPPSFAHFHCAEKLGIPLHLVFTFPYSPTTAFPHPLANIKNTNVDREYTNYMSYPLVDLMTWQGLGDLVNRFRVKTLGLEPVSTLWAPGQMSRLKVPMTYLWSPGLVPKPADWGPEIDIAGYVFLDLGSRFNPPDDMVKFLEKTEDDSRPILYIGFGSISGIDDPRAFCQMIFDAVVKAEVKAIVSRGWGGMGDGMDIPDGVFMVDNVPHDWLFPQVDAVVHHGGAGTTAAGLKFGKPTMIIPFFGDQPFWAAEIAKVGAGAKEALPLKRLDSDKFAQGIRECLEDEAKQKAMQIAKSIEEEGDGAENAVDSFHRSLPLDGKHKMRCGVFDDRVAVWKVKHTGLQMSALAADLLVENKQVEWSDLTLMRHKNWTDFQGPGEPITGLGGVVVTAFQEALHGLTSISDQTKKDMAKLERRKKRKNRRTIVSAYVPNQEMGTPASRISTNIQVPINLIGEAEPHRFPFLHSKKPKKKKNDRPALSRTTTTDTTATERMPTPIVVARDVGMGLGHTAKAIVTLPLEMMNAVTLGFRNAPRLYGDRTVRPPPDAVHGFRSGFFTAGKELFFGFYDGATGIIKIPTLDVQQDGMAGLPKGVARGVGGLVLKPVAGVLGVPTYTSKGVVALLRRLVRDTERTQRWLRRARMQQGAKEAIELKRQKESTQFGSNTSVSRRSDGRLEEARSRVLQRWTSNEQRLLEQARERERSMIPAQLQPNREIIT